MVTLKVIRHLIEPNIDRQVILGSYCVIKNEKRTFLRTHSLYRKNNILGFIEPVHQRK